MDHGTTIDLTQIIVALIGGGFTIVSAVATYLINKYVKDKQAADVLEKALQNGIGYLQQAATNEVVAAHVQIPGVPDSIAPAVKYALDHAIPEIKRLGFTPEAIAEKIIARIGTLNVQSNIATAGNDTLVQPAPLSPVPTNVDNAPATRQTMLPPQAVAAAHAAG